MVSTRATRHLDQVGFIPSWEARDNTTKVLNLVHIASTTQTPHAFFPARMLRKPLIVLTGLL